MRKLQKWGKTKRQKIFFGGIPIRLFRLNCLKNMIMLKIVKPILEGNNGMDNYWS